MDLNALRDSHLVEPEWLSAHLNHPNIRIVDMRGKVKVQTAPDGFQSAEYLGVRQDYEIGHIPGAIYLDWTRDIIDTDDPIPVQIAGLEKISWVMSNAGIGDNTQVIAYDDHPTSQFATRLWWLLRYYSHNNVRVLNGGYGRWVAEGREISVADPEKRTAEFHPIVNEVWRSSAEEVLSQLTNRSCTIIDARDQQQYSGATRRGPRGGHIPGAVNLSRTSLVDASGRYLQPEAMSQAVEQAGIERDCEITAYCNGGVAATSVLFALSMLGFEKLSNYDGSWNEWSKRLDLPTE